MAFLVLQYNICPISIVCCFAFHNFLGSLESWTCIEYYSDMALAEDIRGLTRLVLESLWVLNICS